MVCLQHSSNLLRLSLLLVVGLALPAGLCSRVHAGTEARWRLNETEGVVANDSSGNEDHASLENMDPSTDWGDLALDFDGVNDRVSTQVTVGEAFTWSIWFKLHTQSGYDSLMTIPNQGGAVDGNYMLMDVNGANGSFWANDGLAGQNLGIQGLTTGVWYQLTFVREGNGSSSGYKAYLNGVLQGSKATGNWSSLDTIDLGSRRGVSSQSFHGQLAEAHVFDRALSAEEIAALYAATVRPGLVGHWQLDDAAGFAAQDSSGRNHHGTLEGADTWLLSCDGTGSLAFDGESDYVSIPSHEEFDFDGAGQGFCVAALIHPSDLSHGAGIIGRWSSDANREWLLRISNDGQRIQWLYHEEGGAVRMAESAAGLLELDAWTHVAGLASGGMLTVYVNGVQSGSSVAYTAAALPVAESPVEVGVAERLEYNEKYFEGQMRDVRVYNLALLPTEFAQLAGGLAGHWKFDETSGTTAEDSSGRGNEGLLVNGPNWTSGQLDGGLEFDGSNDHVVTPAVVGTAFTWSAWIKMESQSGYDSIITIPNSGGTLDSNYMLMDMNGQSGSFWANDGLAGQNLGITGLETNEWYHLTFVRRGDNLTEGYVAYLDGERMGSRNSGSWTSNDAIWIGGRKGVSSQYFHGVIDDVRVYQRALCDEEIASLGSGDGPPTGARVIQWVEIP